MSRNRFDDVLDHQLLGRSHDRYFAVLLALVLLFMTTAVAAGIAQVNTSDVAAIGIGAG